MSVRMLLKPLGLGLGHSARRCRSLALARRLVP
jgi:hypothetical protein